MLNPTEDRLDYGELLAPPDNYKLDFAIGTTYSLDLDALVAACLSLGLSIDTDSSISRNPICLLEALRTTGDKIALFCEGGQIHTPNKVTPLYILLEKIVFQINTAKKKGITAYPSFHPKFWLIRYVDDNKMPLYRIIVLSRNLTFDRSWDVVFSMDGYVQEEKTHKNTPIADFLSYLKDALPADSNGSAKAKKMRAIIKELDNVHFTLNSNLFDDFEFLPLGIKDSHGGFYTKEREHFSPLFRDSFHELLIVSPFLTVSTMKEFMNGNTYGNVKYMLFTRDMSLNKLNPDYFWNFKIYTLKDTVVDGESIISQDEFHQLQKQDIHAKIYFVKAFSKGYLYLGSMNASYNATHGNIEFMILLKPKADALSIKHLAKSLFNGSEDSPSNPFQLINLRNIVPDDTEEDKQQDLDGYVKRLIRMMPSASATANGDAFDINIKFESYEDMHYPITIAPLLSKRDTTIQETITFEALQLNEISDFFKVSITDGDNTIQRVVIIPVSGLPVDRDKTVFSSMIKNPACFYNYISFLLDENYIPGPGGDYFEAQPQDASLLHGAMQLPALYEKMLKIAVKDPDRLREIDYLMQAVSEDGVIPKDFEELYNVFKKAVKLK